MAMDQLPGWAGLIHPPKAPHLFQGAETGPVAPDCCSPHQVEVERPLLSSAP